MNKFKLELEMKKAKISNDQMCEALGISRSSFYRKCNGQSQFTLAEIQSITKMLGLESPVDIFFNDEVS